MLNNNNKRDPRLHNNQNFDLASQARLDLEDRTVDGYLDTELIETGQIGMINNQGI